MKSLFEIIGHILLAFFALSEDDKKWILDYLCTKGELRMTKLNLMKI